MTVAWAVWDVTYEANLISVHAKKKGAFKKFLELSYQDWVDAFDSSRTIGKRERFVTEDGRVLYGFWWDDLPRRTINYRVSKLTIED